MIGLFRVSASFPDYTGYLVLAQCDLGDSCRAAASGAVHSSGRPYWLWGCLGASDYAARLGVLTIAGLTPQTTLVTTQIAIYPTASPASVQPSSGPPPG